MKKLLLSIGSIAAVVTPVVAVVSCGKKKEEVTLRSKAVKAIDALVANMDKYDEDTNMPSIHLSFASIKAASSYKNGEADVAKSASAELLFYKQDGSWRTSHSAGFGLPFLKNTGIWTMAGETPSNEVLNNALASETTLKNAKASYNKALGTKDKVVEILKSIQKAITNGALVVAKGDVIVFNHIKIDRDFYFTGSPETEKNKVTYTKTHLGVYGTTDHKYL